MSRNGASSTSRGMATKISSASQSPPRRLSTTAARPCERNELSVVSLVTLYSSRYSLMKRMRPPLEDGEMEPNTSICRRSQGAATMTNPAAQSRAGLQPMREPRGRRAMSYMKAIAKGRPSSRPSLRDRKARPTTTPPMANARRSPRRPRPHSHRASAPRNMKMAKLSGWPTNGEMPAGTATSSPAIAACQEGMPASRPISQVSGATAAPTSQNGRPDATFVGPSSQMNGTCSNAASGIQCAFDGIGRMPSSGSMPPTSTKFQM